MSASERRVDPAFDQEIDAICAKVVTEQFPVVGSISSQRAQVARVTAGDLPAELGIVSLLGLEVMAAGGFRRI